MNAAIAFETKPVVTPSGGPVAVELIPAPVPWLVVQQVASLPHLLFLDSAEKHPQRGRYSYIAADGRLQTRDSPRNGRVKNENTLSHLKEILADCCIPTLEGLPPFQGGFAGLLGYELSRIQETLPQTRFDEFRVPEWALARYDWVISFDHFAKRAWIISSGWDGHRSATVNTQRARSRLTQLLNLLRQPAEAVASNLEPRSDKVQAADLTRQYTLPDFPDVTSNFNRAGYEAAVREAIDYIHAGDCFQVNISQRLLTQLRGRPLELYSRLRRSNPAPFAGYFDLGDFQILSASPERFLHVSKSQVETRPIKGTRRRGGTSAEDEVLIQELINNPKDRAENVMIVDLLRNDLGKVCEYGSVKVPSLCEVESFRYVHHLVSEVTGTLRHGLGPLDLIEATFPGGSVTGAPKVRAMEIIAELEPSARGAYCGCLGWFGFDGASDTNILIRTFTVGRGWVQFPVGGGIVADSDPAREYEETLHKAAGLLQALRSE